MLLEPFGRALGAFDPEKPSAVRFGVAASVPLVSCFLSDLDGPRWQAAAQGIQTRSIRWVGAVSRILAKVSPGLSRFVRGVL